MYLEIDEGYFEHPKTLDLCARLEDPKACVYPLRLWKWACRSAKSGKLGKISAFAIEKAVDYEPRDGKCFAAMCSTVDRGGFIDVAGDGTAEIHDWMSYTGGAIARMDAKVKANKDRREAARKQHDAGTMPELCGNDAGRNPTKTRQDQTSPDKSSQEGESARDPCGTEHQAPPPANEPGKPAPFNVVAKYLAIRAETIGGAKNLFAQPPQSDVTKAAEWIASMTAEECADIEPAIRLACKHVQEGAQGWTNPDMKRVGFGFACIVRAWPDLREELHGCAPKVKTSQPATQRTPTADY
jgi:hypothetical protein